MKSLTQRTDAFLKITPGLLYVGALATLATATSKWLNQWLPLQLETLTVAIILGIIVANIVPSEHPLYNRLKKGIDYAMKTLLLYGIVLLGFKLNFKAIFALGWGLIIGIMAYMALVFLLAVILGRWFKVSRHLVALIAVGSSICGTAAIVAMGPAIEAKEEDTLMAVTIVSFLGAIGVLIYAGVASSAMAISDVGYGIWAGLTLHGMGHALAGAFARGALSGEIGTFVKMTRVLMLAPVSLALGLVFHNPNTLKKRAHIPAYVWGFIACGLLNATGLIPSGAVNLAAQGSTLFILLAMTAMGLGVQLKHFIHGGMKTLWLAITLFAVMAVPTLFILQRLYP